MGVSYREEIRKRSKGAGAPNPAQKQVRLSDKRARDRAEYFRKSHKKLAKNPSAQKATQGRMM